MSLANEILTESAQDGKVNMWTEILSDDSHVYNISIQGTRIPCANFKAASKLFDLLANENDYLLDEHI